MHDIAVAGTNQNALTLDGEVMSASETSAAALICSLLYSDTILFFRDGLCSELEASIQPAAAASEIAGRIITVCKRF